MGNNELTPKQLLSQAIKILADNPDREFCHISWMQRKLIIGYNKACDLIDLLEDRGYIQSPDKMGCRKILKRN